MPRLLSRNYFWYVGFLIAIKTQKTMIIGMKNKLKLVLSSTIIEKTSLIIKLIKLTKMHKSKECIVNFSIFTLEKSGMSNIVYPLSFGYFTSILVLYTPFTLGFFLPHLGQAE